MLPSSSDRFGSSAGCLLCSGWRVVLGVFRFKRDAAILFEDALLLHRLLELLVFPDARGRLPIRCLVGCLSSHFAPALVVFLDLVFGFAAVVRNFGRLEPFATSPDACLGSPAWTRSFSAIAAISCGA